MCREQFVALHDSPILDDLAKEFEDKFGHLTYVCVCVCVYVCVCVCVCQQRVCVSGVCSVCIHACVIKKYFIVFSAMKSTQKKNRPLGRKVPYNVHLKIVCQEEVSTI